MFQKKLNFFLIFLIFLNPPPEETHPNILAHGDAFTAADLAEQIGVSKTTIYRYLDDLKLGGLPIVYHDSCYRLLAEGSHDLAKVMYFTTEEANILFQALANVHDDTLIKQNIRSKLVGFIDSLSLPKCTIQAKNAQNLHLVATAIKEHRQAIFHDYASPSSASVRDRYVEPFAFTT